MSKLENIVIGILAVLGIASLFLCIVMVGSIAYKEFTSPEPWARHSMVCRCK